MLNSLLSEFGSNKSVGASIGRVTSTEILSVVPQYHAATGSIPLAKPRSPKKNTANKFPQGTLHSPSHVVQTAQPELSATHCQAKT